MEMFAAREEVVHTYAAASKANMNQDNTIYNLDNLHIGHKVVDDGECHEEVAAEAGCVGNGSRWLRHLQQIY